LSCFQQYRETLRRLEVSELGKFAVLVTLENHKLIRWMERAGEEEQNGRRALKRTNCGDGS